MTENKRFLIDDAGELIDLNNHKFIEYGDECCKLLNELNDEKSIFFELVETALTDMNCRELCCKGILDIFKEANSLNQAREMIKEHLE